MNTMIRTILFICLCICVYSCTSGTANIQKYENPAQCRLDSIITHYYKASANEFNELALDEMFVQYHDELKSLFDASPVKDWQSQIQSLKTAALAAYGPSKAATAFAVYTAVIIACADWKWNC